MPDPISPPPARRGGLRKRFFAWATAHSRSGEDAAAEARKRALFGGLHGEVLELGPGAGPNLRFLPPGVRWTGVEPNPYMHPYLEKAIRALGRPLEQFTIHPGLGDGTSLPAADASLDAVIGTLVLCSVPSQEGTLREILRVLKPGGRYVFIEHVAAPRGTRLRRSQERIQPLWTWVGDGCHPDRETWAAIGGAGFSRVELEHFALPDGWVAAPHIAGYAVK